MLLHNFEKGAQLALDQILENQVDLVITQSRSPSCGKGIVYDGTFSKKAYKRKWKIRTTLVATQYSSHGY